MPTNHRRRTIRKENLPADAPRRALTAELNAALSKAVSRRDDFAAALFEEWFRERGEAHFFLFRKNLSETNIQFAELLALVRTHIRRKEDQSRLDISCVALPDFIASVRGLASSFHDRKSRKVLPLVFRRCYTTLLEHTVVVECLHGSATVFVPPHLKLDTRRIVAESGYIHSTGRNVYTRELNLASSEGLFRAIRRRLKEKMPRKKLFFAVYAHEDFTMGDRADAKVRRGGLDDVKIYLEKVLCR